MKYLLPEIKSHIKLKNNTDEIIGAEWWVHHRPVGANLGHQLHFDTDEALLDQKQEVTHPLVSSVLYLTGGRNITASASSSKGGSTIVFAQGPKSKAYANHAYISSPVNNSFMAFPGNLLHGVLPCPGDTATRIGEEKDDQPHRLTFMVGFWTRNVPENIRNRSLYSACGEMPPQTKDHCWVQDAFDMYKNVKATEFEKDKQCNKNITLLQIATPAWENVSNHSSVTKEMKQKPTLEFPYSINHRFYVKENGGGVPSYFWNALFEK